VKSGAESPTLTAKAVRVRAKAATRATAQMLVRNRMEEPPYRA
jgi:hypothetical protein